MAYEFKQATLDNGLTVIAECDPNAHSAAIGYFVRTGARDEATVDMGVSHFLEHMMFKGTDKRTAEVLNQDFDRIGARNNAFTSSEMTAFHATVIPEHFETANEILADMMRPALREDDFTTEKGVILEEIAMYDDNPFWVLYERAMEEWYGAHPMSHRVLGTRESITDLPVDRMRTYFGDRYSSDNTVVALAGKVDFDAAVEQVRSLCGHWSRTDAERPARPHDGASQTLDLKDPRFNRAYLLTIAAAPPMGDPSRYAASLLAHVLGAPDNSRLHWALIESGIAEEAEAGFDPRDGMGDFYVYASCDPARADEVQSIIRREIDNLADSLEEKDLLPIRAKAATAVTLSGERPGGRMMRLGRLWTYLNEYTSLEDELERINAVTVDDLRSVLTMYPFEPALTSRLLPGESA